jgi:hypothetical protein
MALPLRPRAGPVESSVQALAFDVFDPADLNAATITQSLKARSAAFIVLAHAEIEYGIEAACYSISGQLSTASEPAMAMLAWGMLQVRGTLDVARLASKRKTPLSVVADNYNVVVNANHGIKENNLYSLLLPLGVNVTALKTDVLTLDAFGSRRGDLAHKPLSMWRTTDLPSNHVTSGVQAARSADLIVEAISLRHSAISPGAPRVRRGWRRGSAQFLYRLADILHG